MHPRASLLSEIEARLPAPHPAGERNRDLRAVGDLLAAVAMLWGTWAVLTFAALPAAMNATLAVALGLGMAHGVLVGHNANHGAMFRSTRVNRAAALVTSGPVISSLAYRQRHLRRHHAHRDQASLCDDLVSTVMRFSPQHRLRAYHRFQYVYVWFFLLIYYLTLWVFDLYFLFSGRDGFQLIETPSLRRTARYLPTKLAFAAALIGVPLMRHSVTDVFVLGAVAAGVAGLTVGMLNLIGHVADLNRVPEIPEGTSPSDARVLRILSVAADVSPDRPLTRWFLGHAHAVHVAHHLWPRMSPYELHGATVSLRATCNDLGLEYHAHPSIAAGIASVVRYLRDMGRAEVLAPARRQSRLGSTPQVGATARPSVFRRAWVSWSATRA